MRLGSWVGKITVNLILQLISSALLITFIHVFLYYVVQKFRITYFTNKVKSKCVCSERACIDVYVFFLCDIFVFESRR